MRVTTAFNRMLGLPGAWVRDVEFGQDGMIVTVVLRSKKPVCSGRGARGLKIKEHRTKPWRHLDQGGLRCRIECRLRRLYCAGCGDVYEIVPWARVGSPYTRDFDDLTGWLAQQMSQTQVTRLMRLGGRRSHTDRRSTVVTCPRSSDPSRRRLTWLRDLGVGSSARKEDLRSPAAGSSRPHHLLHPCLTRLPFAVRIAAMHLQGHARRRDVTVAVRLLLEVVGA